MTSVEIPLTQGRVALVDEADRELIEQFSWCAIRVRKELIYAAAYIPEQKGRRYMHQVLGDAGEGKEWDHINGDGLDNRRQNLQAVTHANNIRKAPQVHQGATSRFRGVCLLPKGSKPWLMQLRGNGRRVTGRFATEIEAAKAYDAAALEHHGRFAVLNFPEASKSAA